MKPATAIIPARYKSQRFPGKALANILGKPVIERVYENAQKAKLIEQIIIATDDERIAETAQKIRAHVRMTSPLHNSGTDRVAEVAQDVSTPIIINIQGDEPLIKGEMIDSLVLALQSESIPMASMMMKITNLELINEPDIVKVVIDREGFALYFSRSPLPFSPGDFFFKHIGIYGYQKNFLLKFIELKPSRMEKIEKLEQLRALENGYRIKMVETEHSTLSVDNPQDIIRIEEFLAKKKND